MNASKKLRIATLLSGGGRTLLNILDEIAAGRLDAEVPVVIASRECKGIERAQSAGLDVRLVAYKDYKRDDGTADTAAYSSAIIKHLDEANVDMVILAGFLSLWNIPPHLEGKVINIHPALLPSFGGKGMYGHHVHKAVLARGCKVSGCSVHFVTNEYDAGPIILQRTIPVYDTDTPDDIAERVFEQECIAFPEAIRLFGQGRLQIDGRVVRIQTEDS